MQKEIIKSANAPAAIGPYSQAVKVGNMVYCSGMIPINPKTNTIPESVADQTEQVITNIKGLLADIGSDLSKIVKTTLFIKNMDDFAVINQVYSKYFETNAPARSTVEVARLPKDVLIEIESIVCLD